MTKVRLTWRKICEILRLKEETGLTNRAIARACKISSSTVGDNMDYFCYISRSKIDQLFASIDGINIDEWQEKKWLNFKDVNKRLAKLLS